MDPMPPVILPAPEPKEPPKVEDSTEEFKGPDELEQEDTATSAGGGEDVASYGEVEKQQRSWGVVFNWRSWGLWGPVSR
jgi:hypothetical protein